MWQPSKPRPRQAGNDAGVSSLPEGAGRVGSTLPGRFIKRAIRSAYRGTSELRTDVLWPDECPACGRLADPGECDACDTPEGKR